MIILLERITVNRLQSFIEKEDRMTERSRLEINIRRLLGQCELLAKEDLTKDWKLEAVNI